MAVLDSGRYRALMAVLAQCRTGPPFIAPADSRSIRKATRKAGRKADKRLIAAVADTDDAALHRARKAAKRARYAAELARPVLGKKKTTKKAAEYKKIQTVLSEHQDSVVAAETLRTLGARTGTTPGENGFAFGLLRARTTGSPAGASRRRATDQLAHSWVGPRVVRVRVGPQPAQSVTRAQTWVVAAKD
jgi:hypothetical protein